LHNTENIRIVIQFKSQYLTDSRRFYFITSWLFES